jgi:hypothetical protein
MRFSCTVAILWYTKEFKTVPAPHNKSAISRDGIEPRFLILLCLEYGRYGTTPMIFLAEDVLQA